MATGTVGRRPGRRGYLTPAQPTDGAASSAITVTGTVAPMGAGVETAWGPVGGDVTPPATGWGAATSDAFGGWSRVTTRPAVAGSYRLFARLTLAPQTTVHSAPVTVT